VRRYFALAALVVAILAFQGISAATTTVDRKQNEQIAQLSTRVSGLESRVSALEAPAPAPEPEPTPEPEPEPTPEPPKTSGCFASPHLCGYPDATNAGVPAGTSLTSSGSVRLTSGQTLKGKDVTGTVTVAGSNVTIEDSKVHTPSGGSGSTAIVLENGATNFRLVHSEVYGNGSKTNAPESGVWNHYNNSGAQVIGSYIHGSPDNWEGRVDLVKDSYMIVDAEYSGAHSENIYICGTNAAVEHSTLYNESDETSLIFGDGICGRGNTVSVTNSLLAGGGWMFEPNAKGVSAPVVFTGNRVGRCTTSASQDPWGGYVCSGGADSNGYWPRGGHYGYAADLGSSVTWSGNVWDNDGQTLPKP